MAHASTYEVETQLIISNNLGYISVEDLESLVETINELQKINYVFQRKLKSKY
ncbi:four helix bundle protein [Sphingobacterium lumbrici]|uniref:four helix bundle protein n=1 Tax=Sphingobacterium lumbrici TaxID=2559600 RepID=UPI00112D8A10